MKPLDGIRVLDLTRLLPGPLATLIMADFGAEVIKIEDPKLGDYYRNLPPLVGDKGASFLQLNRNKKSICLNLKKDVGKEAFLKLLETSDVVVESFRPGVMERLGLGYQQLRESNPKIILASLSGFGQDSPYKSLPGHDLNYVSMSGVLDLTGEAGDSPIMPGVQVADIGGGALPLVIGVLLALRSREQTGQGQHIDISMFDGTLAFLVPYLSHYFATGEVPKRGEMRLNGKYPWYSVYKTKDERFLALGALEPKFWRNLCQALNRPDLIEAYNGGAETFEKTRIILKDIFLKKEQQEWYEHLKEKDCCVTPVRDLSELMADPHVQKRSLFANNEAGMPCLKPFIKLSAVSHEGEKPAPDHGEQTEEVLLALGYSQEDIHEMTGQ